MSTTNVLLRCPSRSICPTANGYNPHVCDIRIPGLLTVLMGHIVPSLCIASLIGIRPLCKAGCKVIFDNKKCDVVFDGVVILRGFKDPSTDLWTLPMPTKVCTAPGPTVPPQPGPCKSRAPHLPMDTSDTHTGVTLATFTHSVRIKGCPNLSETLILKYLNPSLATAKGHMKRPRHRL